MLKKLFHRDKKIVRFAKQRPKTAAGIVLVVLVLGFRIVSGMGGQPIDEAQERLTSVALLDVATISQELASVETTAEVEALEQVELKSEVFAKVTRVHVGLGDNVVPGQLLVSFDAANLSAQRAQAVAELDRSLAAKAQLQAQLTAAEANHNKVLVSTNNAIASAQSQLDTARTNLRLGQDAAESAVVRDAYQDLINTLRSTVVVLADALNTADSVLGVENNLVNDAYEDGFSFFAPSLYSRTRATFAGARDARFQAEALLQPLSGQSAVQDLETATVAVEDTLERVSQLLFDTKQILDLSRPVTEGLDDATLTALRSSVSGAQTAVTTAGTGLTNAIQGVDVARNSLSSNQITFEQAERNLSAVRAQASADVAASDASVAQARASLDSQDALIAGARASIANINASLAKTSVRSPIRGTVSVLPLRVGELVSSGALVASVVNTDGLQVKARISSEDIDGIVVGAAARIEERIDAVVTHVAPSIDPQTRKVEVIMAITDETAPVVVGQFVDVSITPAQEPVEDESQSVFVPLSAVRIGADGKYVFVLNEENIVEQKSVEVARISGEKVEITSGLEQVQRIVASVRGIQAGEEVTIQ